MQKINLKKSFAVCMAAVVIMTGGLAGAVDQVNAGQQTDISGEQTLVAGQYNDADIAAYRTDGSLGISNMHFKFERDQTTSSLSSVSADSYPAYYSSVDLGYVTTPKTQGDFGCCWAFGAASAMETYAIKKGLKVAGRRADLSLDFSEKHLAYYTYHAYNDVLGNNAGDLVEQAYSTQYLQMGGNSVRASVTLANGEGPVLESTAPYDTSELGKSLDYKALLHLKNMYAYSMFDSNDNPNLSEIKGAITKYGSVVMTMAYIYGKVLGVDRTPDNYYYPYSYQSNHDVTIVGWDDNYDASNFDYRPSGNGAWLVKNSWGAYTSNGGYFWCSYYDPSMDAAYSYEMESTDSYDNNYFYSNIPRIGTVGSKYRNQKVAIANTYQMKAKGTGYEKITSVGFGTSNYDVKYSLQLYLNGKSGKPTSGKKLLSKAQTGWLAHCGYNTIKLKKPVYVKHGDRVTAAITLTDPSGDTIYVWADVGDGSEKGGDGYYITYDAKKLTNKSMIKIGSSAWADMSTRTLWDGLSYCTNLTAVMNVYTKTPVVTVKSVTAKSKKTVLKWKKTAGASGYAVYRADKKNGKYIRIAMVSAKKLSYTDSTVKKGKKYYYKLAPVRKIDGKTYIGKKSVSQVVKIK